MNKQIYFIRCFFLLFLIPIGLGMLVLFYTVLGIFSLIFFGGAIINLIQYVSVEEDKWLYLENAKEAAVAPFLPIYMFIVSIRDYYKTGKLDI